jgi:hypothetical protein
LWGREFVVRTDHQALTYLLTCRELNDMMRECMVVCVAGFQSLHLILTR